MDREALKRLLEAVGRGEVTADAALDRLRALPYQDLGFARVDLHRSLRHGVPEAVFCPGKTPAQVVASPVSGLEKGRRATMRGEAGQ